MALKSCFAVLFWCCCCCCGLHSIFASGAEPVAASDYYDDDEDDSSSFELKKFLPKDLQSTLDLSEHKPLSFKDIIPDPKLYDKMKPPKLEGSPTKVSFHVTVMSLDSIDEYSMTFAADIFFAQKWKDHRLKLPENMSREYSSNLIYMFQKTHFPDISHFDWFICINKLLEVDWLEDMWRPDSFFKNAKQVTFQTMTVPNHYLWLYKDKYILYMVKLTLVLSCSMNFALYPHDTQECKLQMESLSHTTEDLVFQWDEDLPLEIDPIELPQLQLVCNKTDDCTHLYSTGNFTCLEVVFVLKRRLGYYLFHTYFPTCLIVIMSWISFWIQPEAAPARITLGVTSLLTLSTQHAKSQAALPPVSYLKAVDLFMSTCTLFVFMALMEYCLVNIVLGDSQEVRYQWSGLGLGGSSSLVQHYQHQQQQRHCNNFSSTSIKNEGESNNSNAAGEVDSQPCSYSQEMRTAPPNLKCIISNIQRMERRRRALYVDKVSRVAFPLIFTLLNIIYWIIFSFHTFEL